MSILLGVIHIPVIYIAYGLGILTTHIAIACSDANQKRNRRDHDEDDD